MAKISSKRKEREAEGKVMMAEIFLEMMKDISLQIEDVCPMAIEQHK